MAQFGVMVFGARSARGGFYPTGERRGGLIQMRCRDSCRGEIWVREDVNTEDLWKLHVRDFIGCRLVQEAKGCDYVMRTMQNLNVMNTKTLEHLGNVVPLLLHQHPDLQNLGHPNYPKHSLYVNRKQTYRLFPRNISPDLDTMLCEGGFFYRNEADTVECIWCGAQLNNFRVLVQTTPCFDLWRIHARKNICCALIVLVKGPRYVRRLIDSLTEEQRRQAYQNVVEGDYNYAPGMRDALFGQREDVPREAPQSAALSNATLLQLAVEQRPDINPAVPHGEDINDVVHHQNTNHDATPFLDHEYMAEAELARARRNDDMGRNHEDNDEFRAFVVHPEENHIERDGE